MFAAAQPVTGTLAETYLRGRGITARLTPGPLRFHPACWYRRSADAPPERWPALLAAVTNVDGHITGLQRTWLARDGSDKAPLPEPRRAMGDLLGHGVHFGDGAGIIAAGEGIETVLSLRSVLLRLPCVAALPATHLAAFQFPMELRRLYLVRDDDQAGNHATEHISKRGIAAGLDVRLLSLRLGDLNDDLRTFGVSMVRTQLQTQLAPDDVDWLIQDGTPSERG